MILQKRKEFGFFERYENCKDFIDNFRMYLIKYLLKQRKNEVYCVYASYEDVFVTKLKIKHIHVNYDTLVAKEDKVIKSSV